jgi:methylamine dehydrogenase accessory protein MauD
VSNVWIASLVALWVVVLFIGVLVAGALREIGLIRLRLGADPGALITAEGLPRGASAPAFDAVELTPTRGHPAEYRWQEESSDRLVVAFVSPHCVSCRDLVPHLNEVARTRHDIGFVAVCRGEHEECLGFVIQTKLELRVVLDADGEIERAYDVQSMPFAYLLDEQRRVLVRGIVNDWTHLESLLAEEGTLQPSNGRPAGVAAEPS